MRLASLPLVVALLSASTLAPAVAGTYRVTTLRDGAEPGTLRWAIAQANANPGSTIAFAVAGTITLGSPLPALQRPTVVDGRTAPGFRGTPVVTVDFANQAGLDLAPTAEDTAVRGLSLVNASTAGVTVRASRTEIADNFIGLLPGGQARGNRGDGVKVTANVRQAIIGGRSPVKGVRFFEADNPAAFPVQPVSAWQGLRGYAPNVDRFVLCGTSDSEGVVYIGPLAGGGRAYSVVNPQASVTSVYGPDILDKGRLRLVGSYQPASASGVFNLGFVWEGRPEQLPSGGVFRAIQYPGATYQFTHSTMGGLAVGNADSETKNGAPVGPGIAYVYDVKSGEFVANIRYPGSKSNSAYGIWHNGGDNYTICGGYSPLPVNNLKDQRRPLAQGRAFLVDYNATTKRFSNWTTFRYRNDTFGRSFITHFEGISSAEKGVYTLNADSVKKSDRGPLQGSWVQVRRNADGSFGPARWVDLNYPGVRAGITSSNSVYGNHVVGVVITDGPFAYQATVDVAFTRSNVISANRGNGVAVLGARGVAISQNYIGTDPTGRAALGNRGHGVLLASGAAGNIIGGQEAANNNPTGSEGKDTPVFVVPPQGNLISGNGGSGVLITNRARKNLLSGNFIGTDATGNRALGNQGDGVRIERATGNSLIGCTFRQNPFVFYNVISGNARSGVCLVDAEDTTIQANFLGASADNRRRVPNGLDGLRVAGASRTIQVGGVIPLGNVISGNAGNGIAVTDTATGFLSFNTFGGGFAFGGACPNGQNGILITSSGGNNVIRTCILSGNQGNGVELGGNATGVLVEDTACGTNTALNAPLANGGSGVKISGSAHGNTLGGFQVSVETRTHFSGNGRYGIEIVDQARDNLIVNSNVGLGFALSGGADPSIPNGLGGIYLGSGTARTTIGGNATLQRNRINANEGAGLSLNASTDNAVVNNEIQQNRVVGVVATGACTGTALTSNVITDNGATGLNNLDLSGSTGVTVTP